MNGATLGSIYGGHSSGRIQRILFTQLVNHLIQHLRLIADDIVLPVTWLLFTYKEFTSRTFEQVPHTGTKLLNGRYK